MDSGESVDSTGHPVRVAMVAACAFPANHGTPGAIRELGLHLARQGHQVHVVSYPQSEDIPVESLHIHRVGNPDKDVTGMGIGPSFKRMFYDFLLIPKLIRVIRNERIQIIHAHSYEACIAGAIASLVTRKPLVYNGVMTMADELPSYGFIPSRTIAKWIGSVLDFTVPRMSDFIMVLSDEMKDYYLQLGISDCKMLVVPPGVELEWLSSGNGRQIRERLQLSPETKVVLYTGVLETFQGIDHLLTAMAIVRKANPEALLLIAGNMENKDATERYSQMAEDLGISDCVRFVSGVPLAELPDYLALADVGVVPRPNCPGYPIKLLNYVAASLPVVSFAGSAKSLCHGYSGYVAENDNVDDLAKGIRLFLDDAELASLVGRQARQSLLGTFDWATIARGVAEIYRRLIKNRRHVPRDELGRYFKASYNPVLSNVTQVTDFQRDGVLSYPSLVVSQISGTEPR